MKLTEKEIRALAVCAEEAKGRHERMTSYSGRWDDEKVYWKEVAESAQSGVEKLIAQLPKEGAPCS